MCLKSRQVRFCRRLDFEVIIVDDNSPDGTQEVVRQLQQAYGEDRIVRHTASHISLLTSPALCACSGPDGLGHVKFSRVYLLVAKDMFADLLCGCTRSCSERGLGSLGWVRLLGLLQVILLHNLLSPAQCAEQVKQAAEHF